MQNDNVNTVISPNDAMFRAVPNEESYLKAGRSVAVTIKAATQLAALSPESILDYGCGHGRILRWLQSFWPDAALTGADVTNDQVTFCADTFGANPYLIEKPFSEIELGAKFDLIWLGSIYTHMNQQGWSDLSESLVKHLNPHGMLCLSFAGRCVYDQWASGDLWKINDKEKPAVQKAISDYATDGFGFFPQDFVRIDTWGRSIVKPEWALGFFMAQGGKIILFSERAYATRQDIVCIQFPEKDAG